MSGEIRTASVTPIRNRVPATSPPTLAPRAIPTPMKAPIIADVTCSPD